MACGCCSRGNGAGNSRAANAARRTPSEKWRPVAADDGCDTMRLLSTRRKTAASAFRKSVPRPAYQLPDHSLPRWERMDLGGKLPAFHGHGPEGPIVYHKGPMGSNPLHVGPGRDEHGRPRFNLDDPYCRDVSYAYSPLHDPHLKGWLTSSGTCAFLYRQGLITRDLNVVCSLKEYNEYRRFLGRKHDDAIAAAARDENARDLERNRISAAIANLRKSLARKQWQLDVIKKRKEKPVKKVKEAKKKQPKQKRDTATKRLPKGRAFDINEIETFSEFGRHADGRTDYAKYLGTYMKRSEDEYYLLPSAKRLIKRSAAAAKTESESESRLVGIEARPHKCGIAEEVARNSSLIQHSDTSYGEMTPFSRQLRFRIAVEKMMG